MEIIQLDQWPGRTRLLLKALMHSATPARTAELPALGVAYRGYTINQEKLSRYQQLCEFPSAAEALSLYPGVLSFPLQLALLSDRRFPLKLMGIVHTANCTRIYQNLWGLRNQPLDFKVHFGEQQLSHRGLEFSIHRKVYVARELVWSCESCYLSRCDTGITRPPSPEPGPPVPPRERWQLPGNLGRDYARVSGDFNPIHLWAFSARLFGFKRAIAHGMWSHDRCLAALGTELPELPYSIAVDFKKAVYLPSTVGFASRQDAEGVHFQLQDDSGSLVYLQGRVSPLQHNSQ